MRFLKFLLKFTGSFVLALGLCLFALTTTFTYWGVEVLMRSSSPPGDVPLPIAVASLNSPLSFFDRLPLGSLNYNLQEAGRLVSNGIKELQEFDHLRTELKAHTGALNTGTPNICSVICNSSFVDSVRLKDEKVSYLQQYFKSEKIALQDPLFQLRIQELSAISDFLPADIRKLTQEIAQTPQDASLWKKLGFAIKLQALALKVLPQIEDKFSHLKSELTKSRQYRSWISSCHKGLKTPSQAKKACAANFAAH